MEKQMEQGWTHLEELVAFDPEFTGLIDPGDAAVVGDKLQQCVTSIEPHYKFLCFSVTT